MPTLEQATKRLTKALSQQIGYDEENKKEFGSAARSFLKAWAKQNAVNGSISWNVAGIAVSGEVTLRNNTFEVYVSEPSVGLPGIMYRSLTEDGTYQSGSKQLPKFKTGPNCWATPEQFARMNATQLINQVKRPCDAYGIKFL